MSLGEAIVAYRQDHHLTQEDLASQLFVTRQAVSAWEQGKTWPDPEILAKLNTLMASDFVKPAPPEADAPPSDAVTILLIVVAILVPVIGLAGPLVVLFNRRFPRWSKITAGVVIGVEVLLLVVMILIVLLSAFTVTSTHTTN